MIDQVIARIDANKDANVDRLKDLLRIPCISTDPARGQDMQRGAQWVQDLFVSCGVESRIVETKGHACVLADTGPVSGDGPTVLVYGHYDVQPTGDPALWDSPAFEPTVRDCILFARGSADDKGQALTHLLALEAWRHVAGGTPIRVKYIIEGEEEIGSPNLEKILRDHRDELACDYVVISDTPKFDANTPAITYGTKGMIYKEIIVTGPKQNLHSGSFGGTITNPGNALASILASLRDADNRVTIPGYYDDVRDVTAEDRGRLAALPFDETEFRDSMDVASLEGERQYSTLERRWFRPTLDVNGLHGGFTGEGASTVIPATVMAKVSMRIVPDQDPDRISKSFDEAIHAATPPGVRVEIMEHARCGAYVSPIDSPGMNAAVAAVEAGFGKRPVFTREGGSLPILPLFRDLLGAESIMIGFCTPDCNAHGPNEFFALSDFHNGTKTAAHFLDKLAHAG